MISEVTQGIQRRQTVNPRTTLGFYATIAIAIATLSVTMSGILASTDKVTWLIPWILAVGVGQAVLLAVGVFYINVTNPQNLMLGQITGQEYAEIKRVTTFGDSTRGERAVLLDPTRSGAVALDVAPTSDRRIITETPSSGTVEPTPRAEGGVESVD